MNSELYSSLATRISELERVFLPPASLDGSYTQAEQDKLRALRVLAHAEIEHFLEEYSRILVKDLELELAKNASSSPAVQSWAKKAIVDTKEAINRNQSVNDKTMISLFQHLGIRDLDFDSISSVFLDRLKDFSSRRGMVAHQSAIGVKYVLTPIAEKKILDEIMEYLQAFDQLLIRRRLQGFGS